MMAAVEGKKRSMARVLIWTFATIGAAVIGAIIRDYWEAAHPVVELQSISIAARGGNGFPELDYSLRQTIAEHPYYSAEFDGSPEVQDIVDVIKRNKDTDLSHQAAVETYRKLIDYVKATSPQLPLDIRREDFLKIWGRGPRGGVMEGWAKNVLARLEKELPEHYNKHPEDSKELFVVLESSVINLSEIDEEEHARQMAQVRGPVGVYTRVLLDARRTNLLRRIWIYQDATVLIPFLEAAISRAERSIQQSKEISQQLEQYTTPAGPRHLAVRVIVTNTGRRTLALGTQGVLFLHLPARAANVPEKEISANVLAVEAEPTLISGGEAKVVNYVTQDNLNLIFEAAQYTDADGFRSLYEGGGIRARISIARAGADKNNLVIGPSEIRPIGPKSIDNAFEVIRKSDKAYRNAEGTDG